MVHVQYGTVWRTESCTQVQPCWQKQWPWSRERYICGSRNVLHGYCIANVSAWTIAPRSAALLAAHSPGISCNICGCRLRSVDDSSMTPSGKLVAGAGGMLFVATKLHALVALRYTQYPRIFLNMLAENPSFVTRMTANVCADTFWRSSQGNFSWILQVSGVWLVKLTFWSLPQLL
jgi:hypothetical protein